MEETIETHLVLKPWAKINLYLRILGRRRDGYHEVSTLIHPIALFDELTISRIEDGLVVNCKQEGLPDNIVTKAAQFFFNRIGESPRVKIDLLKQIPIGGGLGGGSSDAANTLLGLNQLYGYPLSKDILHELCVELGMDVPFFLEPRPALCKGRGEIIEKRCDSIKFWCVLVNPGRILSTQEVYKALNFKIKKGILKGKRNFPLKPMVLPVQERGDSRAPHEVLGAMRGKPWVSPIEHLALTDQKTSDNISRFSLEDISPHQNFQFWWGDIYNDLEEPAIRLCPDIGYIKELLGKAGAKRSLVCGSGSTVCGLVNTRREAEEVMERISREGPRDWWIKVVSSYGW